MKQVIFNRETLKIELHFDKADYTVLSDDEKARVKSAFLWSKRGGCWVSRAKEPNLYEAKRIARDLGFGDVEKVGERLTFAEQVERDRERAVKNFANFKRVCKLIFSHERFHHELTVDADILHERASSDLFIL